MDLGFVLIVAFVAAVIETIIGFGSAYYPHTVCGYCD